LKTLSLAYALMLFLTSLQAQEKAAGRSSVLTHVTIVNLTGSAKSRDMDVLITGNRIAGINLSGRVRLPPHVDVINATGKFLIPGLADMHNHLGTSDSIPGPPIPGHEEVTDFRNNLAQMLSWGFTTIFSPSHTSTDLRSFTALRASASQDSTALPRYFGVGRAISVKGGHASLPRFASYLPDTADEARTNVREMSTAGVDAIKLIYDDETHTGRPAVPVMRPDVMQAIIDEAHKHGLKAYAHAPQLKYAKEVLRAGADGVVHAICDAPVDDEFIALMKKNHAIYVTTHSLRYAFADVVEWTQNLETLDERHVIPKDVYERFQSSGGSKRYKAVMGAITNEQLQYLRINLRRVFDAGILVLAGTDTGVPGVLLGVSSQMELVLLVKDGLTPQEALRTATVNAAIMLGRQKDQGSVDRGKLADLVVLDANPFDDIRNIIKINRVIKGGVIYDRAQLLGPH
jgi:imidazolonepropionase-like amidohydrolase